MNEHRSYTRSRHHLPQEHAGSIRIRRLRPPTRAPGADQAPMPPARSAWGSRNRSVGPSRHRRRPNPRHRIRAPRSRRSGTCARGWQSKSARLKRRPTYPSAILTVSVMCLIVFRISTMAHSTSEQSINCFAALFASHDELKQGLSGNRIHKP